MSLESAIQANTKAVHQLIALLTLQRVSETGTPPPAPETPQEDPEEKTIPAPPGMKIIIEKDPVATEQGAIPYSDVKTLILRLSTEKGRDAVMSVLQEFGVVTGLKLKPEEYAIAIARLKVALGEDE